MISIIAQPSQLIVLGRLGENEHRQVLFDITEYLQEYPDATFTLLYMLPGASAAYPVVNTTIDDKYLYWTVTNSDLSVEGLGKCELIVMSGDMVAKSVIYLAKVYPALDGSGPASDPWESWLSRFEAIKDEAEAAAQAAQHYAEEAASYAIRVYMNNDALTFEHINQ